MNSFVDVFIPQYINKMINIKTIPLKVIGLLKRSSG